MIIGRKTRLASILLAAGAALGFGLTAPPARAHHSFAMFDFARTVSVNGTVKDFQWTNPHVVVWIVANGPEATTWTMELTSPGNLTRLGWTRHTLKPGDRVTAELNPLRDGEHGGSLRRVTLLATGQILTSSQAVTSAPK